MSGPKDEWATAVALALLHVAQEEKRPFTLLCFSGAVTYEATVRPGFVHCDGGTSIDAALRRALDIIQEGKAQMQHQLSLEAAASLLKPLGRDAECCEDPLG